MPVLLFWIAVLFLESEFLAVRNYELRTEIRALLHLPVYHLTFSFLAFALFLYRMQAAQLGGLGLDRFSRRAAALHLVVFGAVALGLHPLWRTLKGQPPALQTLSWLAVLGTFMLTWVSAVLRPRNWKPWLQRHAPWLGLALALAALSLGIMRVSNWLWHPLAGGTLNLARAVLAVVYDDVTASPQTYELGTSTFTIRIEPGCSGYEGIGLVSMFTLLFLWLRRKELRFPGALVLLPVGCALSWLINGLRIAVLVIIGTGFSPYVATKGFHSQAGWLTFILTSMVLVLAVEQGGWFQRNPPSGHESPGVEYPAAPYLIPLMAILLGTMLGQALSAHDFAVLYPLRILLACAALAWLPRPPLWPWFSPRAVVVGLGAYLVWAALVPGGPGASVWQHLQGGWAWLWLVFRLLGSSLIIPLAEELAFRGFLMRRLQSADFDSLSPTQVGFLAWILSSLAFAALHQDLLAAFLAGLAYGKLYRRGASLGEVSMAHGITNFCIGLQVLALGHWSLW